MKVLSSLDVLSLRQVVSNGLASLSAAFKAEIHFIKRAWVLLAYLLLTISTIRNNMSARVTISQRLSLLINDHK